MAFRAKLPKGLVDSAGETLNDQADTLMSMQLQEMIRLGRDFLQNPR
jgi:hypothetical protein